MKGTENTAIFRKKKWRIWSGIQRFIKGNDLNMAQVQAQIHKFFKSLIDNTTYLNNITPSRQFKVTEKEISYY